ncbi:hypothetical protein ASPZODRAFT_75150 [Penicilliopsis zonata CBS 506.65]|uniref:BRCT domain-containing protein n=1 Tax=Penicilliopsis zonata CBS 506.65 TaxID=1073090 RepID=A0A1L9S7H6_9EURO|nr:hypothetical protein ASPZODRAFT_75150 [Penicilliopsis zonata CBS 506.65]OJJ43093.1 hypothetical protein ASPZODRAFT_75150 [Penicilliopsis zonata CBS 506.65]
MLVSLTVGKVDAGVAVLLTQDNRLIEFPSVLLPNNISSGSIVDITVSRNHAAETASASAFQALQKRILSTYGVKAPSSPVLRLRNATQTSLVLEWDPIDLATASLKSLSLYRNGSKAGTIPRPLETRSTKISGLAIHTEYTFYLVLRTSAGTYQSEKLTCRTHKMTDLSGITVTAGVIHPQQKEALAAALDRIGGRLIDTVRIDTTHFVCTEGRGPLWEKAVEMNIPVVRPEWVDACEAEGTIVGVRSYYMDADPKTRHLRPTSIVSQHQHAASTTSVAAANALTASTESHADGNQSHLAVHQQDQPLAEPPLTPFPGGGGHEERPVPPEPAPPSPPPKDGGEAEEEEEEKDTAEETPASEEKLKVMDQEEDNGEQFQEEEEEGPSPSEPEEGDNDPGSEEDIAQNPEHADSKAAENGEGELEEISL